MPLFAGVLDSKITSQFFRSPVLAIPGAMCYSIYLYHELLIRILLPYDFAAVRPAPWPLWAALAVQTAVLVPAVLVACVPLFLIAEKPFMILSRDLTLRREARMKPSVRGIRRTNARIASQKRGARPLALIYWPRRPRGPGLL